MDSAGTDAVTAIPPGAAAAIACAVAEYEPEATAAVIASPKQLLSVLLEAARRATEAVAPHIAAAVRAEDAPLHNDAIWRQAAAAVAAERERPVTESEGFRAYRAGVAAGRAEGAAAEVERIRQLATGHTGDCADGCCLRYVLDDLLTGDTP